MEHRKYDIQRLRFPLTGGRAFTEEGQIVTHVKDGATQGAVDMQTGRIVAASQVPVVVPHRAGWVQGKSPSSLYVPPSIPDVIAPWEYSNIWVTYDWDGGYLSGLAHNIDGNGLIYTVEYTYHMIVSYSLAGVRNTRYSSGSAFKYPVRIVIDTTNANYCWIVCEKAGGYPGSLWKMRISPATNIAIVTCSSTVSPYGVITTDDYILFTDRGANPCVRVYQRDGTYVTSFGTGKVQDPIDIVCDSATGDLWVLDGYGVYSSNLHQYNSSFVYQGSLLGSDVLTAEQPCGLARSPDGEFFISVISPTLNRIAYFESDGTFGGFIETPDDPGLESPSGLCYIDDSSPFLLCGSLGQEEVLKYIPTE